MICITKIIEEIHSKVAHASLFDPAVHLAFQATNRSVDLPHLASSGNHHRS